MTSAIAVEVPARLKREIRIVPQLDRYEWLVDWGQTPIGKCALLAAFAICLILVRFEFWIEMTLAVTVLSYFPVQRRKLLSIITLYWLLFHNYWLNWDLLRTMALAERQWADWRLSALVALLLCVVFSFLAFCFQHVRSRRPTLLAKRPVLCIVSGTTFAVIAAGLLPLSGLGRLIAWTLIAVTVPFLWYFAYALKDAGSTSCDGALLQYGTMRPFWGPNSVPHAKGAAYLRKTEAKTPRDLCIVQLKAIKLLVWVFILRLAFRAVVVIGYGDSTNSGPLVSLAHSLHIDALNFGVPRLIDALIQPDLPVQKAWASLALSFPEVMLSMTISGNIIVACCRMSGFNILRNTYRPMESRTLAEFWNRFYYYFKELLVEFFFFPTFTRYFKRYRRLRMFAATFAAAAVGNMVYHFLQGFHYVAEMGLWGAIVGFQAYAFYSALLGIGIGISQLRHQGKNRLSKDAAWWRKMLSTGGVVVFFCFLGIFDLEGRSIPLSRCFQFLFHLFYIPL